MNNASKILIIGLCVVGIVGGSVLAIYYYTPLFHKTMGGGLLTVTCGDPHLYCGGTSTNGSVGWQVPAYTMISTSFVANESLNTFLNASPTLIPYNIQSNSSIYFGLYVNGDLKANMSYNMNDGHYTPASVTTTIQNQTNGDNLAVFTNDFVGYTVSFSLGSGTSIPSGSTITVLMFANNPVWVQVANSNSPIHSYETNVSTGTTSLPNNIIPNSGSRAPQTVSIGLFSDYN